jgi:hypothetical protein
LCDMFKNRPDLLQAIKEFSLSFNAKSQGKWIKCNLLVTRLSQFVTRLSRFVT